MRDNGLKKTIAGFLILSTIPFFVFGVLWKDTFIIWCTIFIVWLGLFIYNFSRKKVMIFSFLITFFMFLLGEIFINQFDDTAFHAINTESIIHAYICVYLSLVFFQIGTMLNRHKIVCKGFSIKKKSNDENIKYIQKSCTILYLIFGTCSLAVVSERLILSWTLGSYTATFINFKSSLPGMVTQFAGMADMVFFLYLATVPDPRKSKLVLGLKVFISLVLLVFGTRSTIIMTFIIIFVYCIYYENLEGKEYQIIHKSIYILIAMMLPIILILFDYIMAYRDGRAYTFNGVGDSLKHIITSVGGSINVITYGYEKNALLPDKLYSIGGIIDFFTKNIFARKILGVQQYGGNTVEMALYGNSFSNALTYIVKRASYLSGYGMGSSYIAEVFHDFGYFGIAVINVIYGKILSTTDKLEKSRFIKNTIVLMASYNILVAPRAYADGFLSCFLNFSFMLTVAMVYGLANIIRKYKR